MQERDLTQLVENAIASTEAFIEVLMSEGLNSWASRFSTIASLLRQGDIQSAKYHFSNCSYTGPGSLSDAFAKDEVAFNRAWGHCASNIRALAKA
jgi:hypothetical protein